MPPPGFIPLSDSELNVRAQNIAPLQDGASLLGSGPTHYMPKLQLSPNATILQAIGAVFFRRSRLFFREAAFFSGGEGCEWRAQRATVSREWGYNGENSFSALSPFAGSRKGFSPHIPASRLFVLFHLTQAPIPLNPFAGQYTRLLKERGGEKCAWISQSGRTSFLEI